MQTSMIPFATWQDLLDEVRSGGRVRYAGPLDVRPRLVSASLTGAKKNRLRIAPFGYWPRGRRPFDAFVAGPGQLDRFSREA